MAEESANHVGLPPKEDESYLARLVIKMDEILVARRKRGEGKQSRPVGRDPRLDKRKGYGDVYEVA